MAVPNGLSENAGATQSHLQFGCIRSNIEAMSAKTIAREVVDGLLRRSGLRATPARRAILRAMHDAGPLREEEIAFRVGTDCPDPATVYRTLSTLVKIGLVRRHQFRNRVSYFSLHLPGTPECTHPHFVCENCGQCECLDDARLPALKLKPDDRLIKGVEVVVNGLCRSCRNAARRR